MAVGATTGTNGSTGANTEAPKTTAERSNGLGRDAFLQLLITQLANQNPLQPQADGEFIAQMAQFSSLEQLTNMNTTLTKVATALGVPTDTEQPAKDQKTT